MQERLCLEAHLLASPLRASETPTRTYSISIEIRNHNVAVREKSARPLLPTYCPQRHLNPDGTFCLGLSAGVALDAPDKRRAWWKKLLVFLTCQDTAAETRTWPTALQFSHGEAGFTEALAEDEAEKMGLLEEYQSAVRYDNGFIARAVGLLNTSTGRLRNARAFCICGRTNKRGRRKLRRECHAAGDVCLIMLEAKRRAQEEEFWGSLIGKRECCGTMDYCPLK